MTVFNDPALEALLTALHARSNAQLEEMRKPKDDEADRAALTEDERLARQKLFVSDKLVALDRDKAEFCYQVCCATDARRIVEIGTSYGVSTLYLAAAVRDNIAARGGEGLVIGTEYEAGKVEAARQNFAAAGLSPYIDLREGDLRETLAELEGPIDFVLVDIWIDMARPGLAAVFPHLRDGAVVVCDNTDRFRDRYQDYLDFIGRNGFSTTTLPFDGGLEFSVRLR